MARVGRQSDPGKEVRPAGSPRLHLLVCTSCWHRPWDCTCEVKRTKDRQHVSSAAWRRVPVHTAGDVLAAIVAVTGDRDVAHEVVERLTGGEQSGEARRPTRATERPGSRHEGGRLVA